MATYTYTVTAAPDNSAYLINGVANPPLDLKSGNTYIFNVQAPNHPFYIKTDRVLGDGSAYSFQVTGNGATQGNVTIVLPLGPEPKLFYQCGSHIQMGGTLTNVRHINNSIKHALGDQLPGFVSAEYPMFQKFLEAYYEWLSAPGNVDYNVQSVLSNADVDNSVDLYLQHLETEFLAQIPKDIEIDKKTLIKNIRSFYNSKGTEKSYEFLFNILFNENVEFYYPKNDILRASDGKWKTVTSVRLLNDNNYDVFALTGKTIVQNYVFVNPETNLPETRVWATAKVERIIQFFLGDTLITEAYLSNLSGLGDFNYSTSDDPADFEYVFYLDTENNPLEFRVVPMVTTVTVENQGTGYSAGTILQVDTAAGDSGVGALAQISSIYPGDVSGIDIINAGSGYKVNDIISFERTAQVGGSGAAAFVSDVSTDGMQYEAESIDYRGRGTPGSPVVYEEIADVLNGDTTTFAREFIFSVHGPGTLTLNGTLVNITEVEYGGTVLFDYFRVYTGDTLAEVQASTTPDIDGAGLAVINNYSLGIDGDKFIRIEVTASITGAVYDEGAGQAPEVSLTNTYLFQADGSIREIKIANSGSGYRRVPVASVISETGTGAAIRARGDTIGRIKEVKILNQNFGALYYQNPTIDMTNYGNGDAIVTMSTGSVARHPGSFSNDDGHLSEAKYLQDNKYYQTFSYVLRTGLSIENYRDTIKKLVHPAGMELFGEVFITNNLRAGLFNNYTNDPNDLIVSERLGGLQVPKYKKTIMLFKKTFAEQVTYGSGFRSGELYQRPDVVSRKVNVIDDTSIEYERGRVTLTLVAPNVGVDPTDIEVFSFPVLKFPIQTDIENIIIDNTVEITKNIQRHIHNQVPDGNLEVVQTYTFKKLLTQEVVQGNGFVTDTRSEREIHKELDTQIRSAKTHREREITVGVGELRDINLLQSISDVDSQFNDIKDWARDLSLHVRIDSRLIDKYSVQVLDIILNTNVEVDTFRTLMPEISLNTQVLNSATYHQEFELSKYIANETTQNRTSHLRPTVIQMLDLTIDTQREIHRHWTTHNYLLTAPQSVSVEMVLPEPKTNEITILSGFKELHELSDLIIGDLDSATIRSLDPTFLQVIPRDFIYRNIPIQKLVTKIETIANHVSGGQHLKRSITRNSDLTIDTTFQRRVSFAEEVSTKLQTLDDAQDIGKNMNLFNGFIYKIENESIGSFDPDNTQIRSIANSQLVSTTLMGYIRDSNNNIIDTL